MIKIPLRLRAGYMEEPVMTKTSDIHTHIEVEDLSISQELKSDILAWDEMYQNTFNNTDPSASGFSTTEEIEEHKLRGADLANRLRIELGETYLVEYKTF